MTQTDRAPALITWPGYLALTLLLALPIAVLMVRTGDWQTGLALYALACLGSVLLLIMFIALLLLPRFAAQRGALRQRLLFTLPGTVALLSLTLGGGDYPRIHDITTDTADPPQFVAAPNERGAGANPLTLEAAVIDAQKAAYPDLTTLNSDLVVSAAFDRALAVAAQLGWRVYHSDSTAGIIEAVETTRIMAFKDDIVIRIRSTGSGSEIDLRSVSRVGEGDLGANAKRIRTFIAAFNGA